VWSRRKTMSLFYFILKDGYRSIPDKEGMDLPDQEAAREHAIAVGRELMRNNELKTRSWRLEVRDDYLHPSSEILLADFDTSIEGFPPAVRETIKTVARTTAAYQKAILDVQTSLDQIAQTLTSADGLISSTSPWPRLSP